VTDLFSTRRALDPPVGVARDFVCGSFGDPHLAELASSPSIQMWLQRDTMPIPSARDREGYYGERHYEFWLSGLSDYLKIKEACPEMNWAGARLLDFGGATGRVARHCYAQENMGDVIVCDVNINNVDWVIENLPSGVSAFKNSALPTLPISDSYFDIITAFSVFTHMGEYELAWLYELKRVLKPDGVLYITVQNDDTWNVLPTTGMYSFLMESEEFRNTYAANRELRERLAFKYSSEAAYNCHTFHPNSYIHRVWSKMFKVVGIRPNFHEYQAAVILGNG
jgi:ubiquinone/menaquinone biosynthesis C-methylase UbiE